MTVSPSFSGSVRGVVAAGVVALSLLLSLAVAPAAHAVGGGVGGTVTDGVNPVSGITVTVLGYFYGNQIGSAVTDGAGGYSIAAVPGAKVKVQFSDPTFNWSTVFNGGAATFASAAVLTVPASGYVTADVVLSPYKGSISGTVSDLTPTGLSGISVSVFNPVYGNQVASATTDGAGGYSVTGLYPGNYRVQFAGPGFATIWNGGAFAMKAATDVVVTSNTTTTNVDVTMSAPVTITGTLTAGASGMALPGIWAIVATTTAPVVIVAGAPTDGAGKYTVTGLNPSDYKVLFLDPAYVDNTTKGLRPEMYGDQDVITLGLAGAYAASTPISAVGPGASTADGQLTGIDCTMAPGTDLTGADLTGKNLTGCDLTGTNLTNAILAGVDLTGADLTAATLTGVSSGGINGTPAALPANWTLVDGYLVGPGANFPPSFTAANPPSTTEGAAYSYTYAASGGPTTTLSASGLPSWLTFNPGTGVLSAATAPAMGHYGPFTITATNADGTASATNQFVNVGPAVTTTTVGPGNPGGGSPSDSRCPSGSVLTGMHVQTDGYLRTVTPNCTWLLEAAGSVSLGGSAPDPVRIGTFGGTGQDATCPAGQVVTGFSGRAGAVVDGIQLYCTPLNPDRSVDWWESAPSAAYVGGFGGNPFGFVQCPNTSTYPWTFPHVATGIFGRAGEGIDYFALDCSRNGITTATALSAGTNPSAFGAAVTFSATISSTSGATPTGTVTFKDGGSAMGDPVALVGGVATLTTSSLSAGAHAITAEYSGDIYDNFAPSTSATLTHDVTKLDQTVSFTSVPPAPAFEGAGYTPTATATSGLPVSFSVSGTCSISSGVVTFDSAGSCTVHADQDGDSTYDPAPQGTQDITVVAPYSSTPSSQNSTDHAGATAVGDLNGDGIPDLVTANRYYESVAVFFGVGDGAFSPGVTFPSGGDSNSVALGDLDVDGDLDAVAANRNGNLTVLLNDGSGNLLPPVVVPGYADYRSVVVADLDGDGCLDAASNASQLLRVYAGDCSGTLTFAESVASPGSAAGENTVAADIDGVGGTNDLVAASAGSGSLWVFVHTPGSDFGFDAYQIEGAGARSVAVADFNGDGRDDIVGALGIGTQTTVWLNAGVAPYLGGPTSLYGGPLATAFAVAAGDVNGDGQADIVTSSGMGDPLTVRPGRGDGTFGEVITLGPYSGAMVTLADLNADGRLDIVTPVDSAVAGAYWNKVLVYLHV